MTGARRKKPASIAPAAEPAVRPPEAFLSVAAGIFAVALTVRLIHIWQLRGTPFFSVLMGDALGYDAWAQRIARGDWLGGEVFYQAPLYPYFLGTIYAIAGRHLLMVRVCQAVIGSAACALLGVTAWRLFSTRAGAKRAGMFAGLALALYAPAIFFDGLIQKSVLDVFFICLMLWIAAGIIQHPDRRRSWLWLGLATGGLALTRENALVFVVVILVWALMSVRTVRLKPAPTSAHVGSGVSRIAMFLLGLAIVLMPVAFRNYAVGGGFYLTTSQFGPNFFIGNNAQADGTYRSLRPGRGAPEFERQDATELAEQASGRSLTPAEVSTYWTDRALGFITSQPGAWLKLVGRKFLLLSNREEMIDTESQESYAEWSAPVRWGAWFGHFGLLVPVALFGAWIRWPERDRLWPFYAMTAAYAASLLLFYVFARYRYPLAPLLMLFAAGGIAAAPRFARASSSAQRVGAIALLLVAVIFANWPLVSSGLPQAVTETNLGMALQAEGQLDAATAHFQRAIAFSADHTPAHNGIGLVLRAKGQSDQAIKAFERAIASRPTHPDAHYNLAVELQTRGDHEKAIEQLREYIRLVADDANAIPANNMIGLSLLAQGKLAEAAAAFRQSLAEQPRNADARGSLADTLLKQGRFEDAVREFREYVRLVPGNAAAFHNLGLSLVGLGKEQDAVAAFGQAAVLQPSSAAFHQDVGHALASVGRLDEAVVSYTRALELAPASVGIHNALGLVLAAQGKMQEALAHFQRSLELDPHNAETRADLDAVMRRAATSRP
jgi:tetratricopeptide (TPR) repeat protein